MPHSAQLYRILAENTPDAIVTIDERSVVLSMNPAAEHLFGWSAAELVGEPLTRVMPETLGVRHQRGMERYLATGTRSIPWRGVRVSVLRRDGRQVPVEITFGEFVVEGRRAFSGIIRDLSAQVEAEEALGTTNQQLQEQAAELEQQMEEAQTLAEELEHSNEELHAALEVAARAQRRAEFLADTTQKLASSLDYHATIAAVVHAAVPALGDWCAVDIVEDPERGAWPPKLERLAIHHQDPEKLALARWLEREYPRDWNTDGGLARVLRSGEPMYVEQIPDAMIEAAARDARHLEALRSLRFTSVIIVPLEVDGVRIGALSLATTESGRRLEQADVLLAREIAARAGSAVRHAQLYERAVAARAEAEAAADRMRRLQTVTEALAGTTTAQDVGTRVLEAGLAALGASSGLLYGLEDGADGRGPALRLIHAIGASERALEQMRTLPLDAPVPVVETVRTGAPLYLENWDELVTRFPRVAAVSSGHGTQGWAVLPVLAAGKVNGSLAWGFGDARPFSPDERVFLETIAAQCGQALERVRLLEMERRARASAEAANKAKAEFLASMSHELRTPLNAITGHTQLMQLEVHGQLSEPQRDALERVQRSAAHLLALINDVLNFARLESGKLSYNIADVAVADVVEELGALLAPQFSAHDLRFRHRGGEQLRVRADRDKLHQILLNLFSNAIKFTPEGGEVAVHCEEAGEMLAIAVTDTGIGIDAEQHEAIFAPFVQVNRTLRSTHEGAGLGLAISRDLARAMGGDITVQSEPGAGASFTLTLPASG